MIFSETDLILNADGSVYHLNLRPEHLADTIIAVGDPDRVEKVSRNFDSIDVKIKKREFVTHTGTLNGKRISVVSSGIGTDNVEILLTELDALANIDLEKRELKNEHKTLRIVRIGTSGALQTDIDCGTFLASATGYGLDALMLYYEHDFYTPTTAQLKTQLKLPFEPYAAPASDKLLALFKELPQGNTITCPGFYAPQGRTVRLKPSIANLLEQLQDFRIADQPKWRFTNFEMETAGYYALGSCLGHELLSLNAIVANRPTRQFDKNSEQNIEKLILLALERLSI